MILCDTIWFYFDTAHKIKAHLFRCAFLPSGAGGITSSDRLLSRAVDQKQCVILSHAGWLSLRKNANGIWFFLRSIHPHIVFDHQVELAGFEPASRQVINIPPTCLASGSFSTTGWLEAAHPQLILFGFAPD